MESHHTEPSILLWFFSNNRVADQISKLVCPTVLTVNIYSIGRFLVGIMYFYPLQSIW